MNTYELFNFSDPIEEAFESVIESAISGLSVRLARSTTEPKDIDVSVLFTDGTASGQKVRVELDEDRALTDPYWVFNHFVGGVVEVQIARSRWSAETVADNAESGEEADQTCRDVLSQLAGRIRYALRRADAADLNAALSSPKISYIKPLAGLREQESELGMDFLTLRYELNYGIPDAVWPQVILTEEGFMIHAELSEPGDLGEVITTE